MRAGTSVLVAGLAALVLAACGGPPPKTTEMTAYEEMRGARQADRVKERFPELVRESDKAYEKANEEHADDEPEMALHYTRLATLKWRAALAMSKTQDAREAQRAAENRQRSAEEELSVLQRRRQTAHDAVERLKRIRDLEKTVATGQRAEKINAARQKVKDAIGMDAAKYDPTALAKAERSLAAADNALQVGNLKESDRLGEIAMADADALIAAVQPKYEVERRQREVEAQYRAMLEATTGIPSMKGRIVQRGFILTLRGTFRSNKTEVLPEQMGTLDRVVEMAKKYPEFKLVVEGHTDNQGGAQRNLVLSQGRAQVVVSYLIDRGVDPSRLTPIGKGQDEPIADNRQRTGREENRRVEVVFLRPS